MSYPDLRRENEDALRGSLTAARNIEGHGDHEINWQRNNLVGSTFDTNRLLSRISSLPMWRGRYCASPTSGTQLIRNLRFFVTIVFFVVHNRHGGTNSLRRCMVGKRFDQESNEVLVRRGE